MLNKINEVKTGRKKPEQNQVISNSFTNLISKSREEVLLLEIVLKWLLKLNTKQNMEQDLKY